MPHQPGVFRFSWPPMTFWFRDCVVCLCVWGGSSTRQNIYSAGTDCGRGNVIPELANMVAHHLDSIFARVQQAQHFRQACCGSSSGYPFSTRILVFFQNFSSDLIIYLYSTPNPFLETEREGILSSTTEKAAHYTCHFSVYHLDLISYSFITLTNIIGNHITKLVKAINLIYIPGHQVQ